MCTAWFVSQIKLFIRNFNNGHFLRFVTNKVTKFQENRSLLIVARILIRQDGSATPKI